MNKVIDLAEARIENIAIKREEKYGPDTAEMLKRNLGTIDIDVFKKYYKKNKK